MLKALSGYVRQHHLALIALFVALGGVSYAAVNLPNNSVGAGEIKKNAVRAAEIRKNAVGSSEVGANTLKGVDIQESSLGTIPSANKANSATTATSAATAGSSNPEAFVHIIDQGTTGTVDASASKGVSSANVTFADSGDTACFHGLAFQPRGGQVTTDYFDAAAPAIPQLGVGPVGGCPVGTQAFTWTPGDNQSIYVLFYR